MKRINSVFLKKKFFFIDFATYNTRLYKQTNKEIYLLIILKATNRKKERESERHRKRKTRNKIKKKNKKKIMVIQFH